jgi:hypothetical protein
MTDPVEPPGDDVTDKEQWAARLIQVRSNIITVSQSVSV